MTAEPPGSPDADLRAAVAHPCLDLGAGRARPCGDDVIDARGGDDDITDGSGADTVEGGPGDDILRAQSDYQDEGDDSYSGGDGTDTLGLAEARTEGQLVVDLAAGTITGIGSDVESGIENLLGSFEDDVLRGDDGPNRIDARGGDDELTGGAGDDVLVGSRGQDSADGGDGTDTCTAETVAACEG